MEREVKFSTESLRFLSKLGVDINQIKDNKNIYKDSVTNSKYYVVYNGRKYLHKSNVLEEFDISNQKFDKAVDLGLSRAEAIDYILKNDKHRVFVNGKWFRTLDAVAAYYGLSASSIKYRKVNCNDTVEQAVNHLLSKEKR